MPARIPVSFEFFPPKTTQGCEKLVQVAQTLAQWSPEYYSVTFGAGGSTLSQTPETVKTLRDQGFNVVPHISCISSTQQEIHNLLQQYHSQGISRLLVLRGDKPKEELKPRGDFAFASQLVSFIRQHFADHFFLEVACYPECHPEADDLPQDLHYFAAKVRAGANRAITQYFYNADSYTNFVTQLRKMDINIPIVPGIMPIANVEAILRFSQRCGAEIPRWLFKMLMAYQDDPLKQREISLDVVTRLCARLIDAGAPALHFYTLNKADSVNAILEALVAAGYPVVPQSQQAALVSI